MNARPPVAVLGCGRMGRGLAQAFAYAGFPVRLIDAKPRAPAAAEQALCEAKAEIERGLAFLAECAVLPASTLPETLARVECVAESGMRRGLAGAKAVFEGVPEVLETKRALLGRLGGLIDADAVVASTTSTFLVDTLAQSAPDAARFINTHWLNPAPLIPLVEVSPGTATAPEVTRQMVSWLEAAGKVPVICAAAPGFIVPRIQALAMNEAARLVEEGVASAADIDKATRVGFGIRFAILGLIEFIDWGGGDILYYADNYLKDALGADRFAVPRVVADNMRNGRIGVKTGSGFHDYRNRDVAAYQRETVRRLVGLLRHLDLLAPPGGRG